MFTNIIILCIALCFCTFGSRIKPCLIKMNVKLYSTLTDDCTLINHKVTIDEIYKTSVDDNCIKSYELTGKLFTIIIHSKETGSKRKRLYNSETIHIEAIKIKYMYESFLTKLPLDMKDNSCNNYCQTETSVRELAHNLFKTTVFDHSGLNGGNNSNTSIKCKIREESFLIPPNSRFYCGCVKEQCAKLEGNNYDLLIADPPWWNKYIRRLKNANGKLGYEMMYNEDIASIPVANLLGSDCLVAVWCTNSPSNIDALKHTIFPQWGVTYVTTWYWLKITVDYQPVTPFAAGLAKQPFERIIIGKIGNVKVPETKLIISVPSAIHSHKPPLLDLLKPYVKSENPKTLELFARYLLPNTTSVGYEPLKLQHLSLYDEVSITK